MRTALAVSPHLDDAAFSAGATLWTMAQQGWQVIVATVFTGNVDQPTGFALACQLDKGLGPEVDYMALRRSEDRAACAALGAEPLHLPLLEAPHRGYDDATALFAAARLDDPAHGQVQEQLAVLLNDRQPDLIMGPLGVGNHVDHLVVREALVALASETDVQLWEDWPYLERSAARDRGRASRTALTPQSRAAKLKACTAYRSQLGFQFGGHERLRSALASQDAEYLHPLPRAST